MDRQIKRMFLKIPVSLQSKNTTNGAGDVMYNAPVTVFCFKRGKKTLTITVGGKQITSEEQILVDEKVGLQIKVDDQLKFSDDDKSYTVLGKKPIYKECGILDGMVLYL